MSGDSPEMKDFASSVKEALASAPSEPHKVSEPMNELEVYRHLQKIEAENANFKDVIRYMAENAHQAYHHGGGWWDCPKNICTAAQQAIPEYAQWLAGKGPKP